MTKNLSILSLLLACSLFAVNVRDFGAIGDGVADDTDAIQRAMDAARAGESFVLVGRSELPEWGGHGGHGGSGEVFLPAGTYRLTRPLVCDYRHVMLRGEKGTTIVGAPNQDILYFHGIGRACIENLRFEGGRIQLNFFTNNNDMTMIRIQGCDFVNAELESIRAYNAKAKEWRGISTYLVERPNGGLPILKENPEYATSPELLPNSTVFTISDCEFQGSGTFLCGGSDQLVIENTAFHRVGGTLPILHMSGQTNMRNVRGTYEAPVPGGPDAWITREPYDNRVEAAMGSDLLCMEACEFRCEAGAPLTILRTTSKPWFYNSGIRLLGCDFDLAGAPLLRFAPGCLVGLLELRDNHNLANETAPAAVFEQIPTMEEIQTQIRYKYFDFAPVETQFHFLVADNDGFTEELPEVFQPFLDKAPSRKALADTAVKPIPQKAWPKESDFHGKVIRPVFDGTTPDDQILQKAFDQARPGDRIILPARWLTLTATVRMPAGVELTAEGTALLNTPEGQERKILALLRIEGAAPKTLFRNIAFANGQLALDIQSSQGTFALQNCLFLGQFNTAIQALNAPDAILLTDCLYYAFGGLRTNAKHSEVRRSWMCNCSLAENTAFFENYGGELMAEYNLFVPILPRTDISNFQPKPEYAYLACENNLRWFDNHAGKLYLDCNRLGGEFNGMTPVYLYGNNATCRLQGSLCWFGNRYTRSCAIYCHDSPKAVLFDGVVFNGESWLKDHPYNIMLRDPKTDADLPGAILPEAEGTALIFYR